MKHTCDDGVCPYHGTVKRHRKPHYCRCDRCRLAYNEWMRDYRQEVGLTKETHGPMKPAEHGTRSMYLKCTAGPNGGKCAPCREANTEYQKMYNQGVTLTGKRVPQRSPRRTSDS